LRLLGSVIGFPALADAGELKKKYVLQPLPQPSLIFNFY